MSNGCHVKPEQMFNLIFGYHDTLHVEKSVVATGSPVTVNCDAPPTDEVWWIQYITFLDESRQCTVVVPIVMEAGANAMDVDTRAPVGSAWTTGIKTDIVIKNPDFIRVQAYTPQNGDTCNVWLHGYKMKLTQ